MPQDFASGVSQHVTGWKRGVAVEGGRAKADAQVSPFTDEEQDPFAMGVREVEQGKGM